MARPLHLSPIPDECAPKCPELGSLGAGMMKQTPMPVQKEIWALLDAQVDGLPLYENTAIEVPRRAGKTGGIFQEAIARCRTRERYQVAYAAQSGIKSRARFMELQRLLSPGDWTAYSARGEEQIRFGNGSLLQFYPPKADSFRGDAIDWIIFDEAQEYKPEDAEELLGSILPVFDTREGPQLTVAGTAGKVREGLLWEALENGRAGLWGIIEYAAPEGFDINDESKWLDIHPGPAGVSQERALEVLRKRRASMSDEMFSREYLGMWPESTSKTAFDREVWQLLGREHGDQPSRIGIGLDVAPDSEVPAVCVAWRDASGLAYVELVSERTAETIIVLAKKFRSPITHDTRGPQTLNFIDEIARKARGTVKFRGLTTMEFAASCVAFDKEVRNSTLRHFRQPEMESAIEVASRRPIGDAGWGWGRKISTGSIAPLVAATVALRGYDDLPEARVLKVLTAKGA